LPDGISDILMSSVMQAYLPSLAHYSNNMRIICTPIYSATEGFFGLNMNPSLPPDETFYVLIPSVAYYEFIPIGAPKGLSELRSTASSKIHPTESTDEDVSVGKANARDERILDLVSLEVGQQYEIVVTTISGEFLLRSVTGFYLEELPKRVVTKMEGN
jgi:auxin responsive GH3 family protein